MVGLQSAGTATSSNTLFALGRWNYL